MPKTLKIKKGGKNRSQFQTTPRAYEMFSPYLKIISQYKTKINNKSPKIGENIPNGRSDRTGSGVIRSVRWKQVAFINITHLYNYNSELRTLI